MINLLLVEDEAPIRNGILKHIPFEELGIQTVRSTSNAEEALQLDDFVPDIILSDIRMPGMSGMQMCSLFRERYKDCQIIFISGFSDKEYLTTAIRLSVIRYIEKPIDVDELTDALNRAVKAVKSIRRNKRNLLHSLLFQPPELLNPEVSEERITVKKHFLLLCLQAKEEIFSIYSVADALFIQLQKEKILAEDILAGIVSTGQYVLLLRRMKEFLPEEKESIAQELLGLRKTEEMWFISVSENIGGGEYPLIGEIREVYQHAKKRNKCLAYTGWNKTVFAGEQFSELHTKFTAEEEEKLSRLLQDKDRQGTLFFIQSYCRRLIEAKATLNTQLRHNFYRMQNVIERAFSPVGREAEEAREFNFLDEAVTIAEMGEYLCSLSEDALERRQNTSNHYIIKQVCEYIEEHLGDVGLGALQLSSIACLAPTYLSALFRKKTGKTIVEYIMDLRIQRACLLLKNPGLKQYEIAQMVGYDDAKYFAKIFKKKMGMPPSEYREELP